MAAGDELGFLDYLKAAFWRRRKVPLLGHLPLNQLALAAFAVLGLANPGFWLLGAAFEILFLTLVASSERFQRLVRAERMMAAKESYEARVERAMARLSPASQERYRRLLEQCRRVLGVSAALEEDELVGGMRSLRTGGLNQLLWIFLRLLASREVLEQNVAGADRRALEAEIAELEKRLAAAEPDSALARSLSGTLDIQRKRLDNLARAEESRAVVDAELERIERQVVLLREETAVRGKAEILSSRLDAVTGALSETNRWMEQNAEIFGAIGADPLGAAPAELPELPRAMEREG
ncbi:MAG: hypothetical protein D6696_06610 [Acidobacteria bacterium]|nr:MAG: hypothetical protein D6696_06610 [Acidobacteriota bacterium]